MSSKSHDVVLIANIGGGVGKREEIEAEICAYKSITFFSRKSNITSWDS